MGRANGLGRIFGGVLATRGAFSDEDGRGAASHGIGRVLLLALIAICTTALLLAPGALAATVTQRPILFTINGDEVPGGPMRGGNTVAVDKVSGAIYVSDFQGAPQGRIYRFHADGTPWAFPATGLPYIEGVGYADLAVDNSGGPNQGRLYAGEFSSQLKAFNPNGELLWSLPISGQSRAVAVDPTGHPYVAVAPLLGSPAVRKYANSGSPPALESSFSAGGKGIDVNAAGDVFLASGGLNSTVKKWVGGVFSSTLDPHGTDVELDQSSPSGHIFTAYYGENEIQELKIGATAGQFRLSFGGAQTPDLAFDASGVQIREALRALPTVGSGGLDLGQEGPLSEHRWRIYFSGGLLQHSDVELVGCENGTTPLSGGAGCSVTTVTPGEDSDLQEYAADGTLLGTFGVGDLLNAKGVAYDSALDRVYVLDAREGAEYPAALVAFGPSVTGTAPDVTIDPPSAIGVATAHFSGTVNPQGTTSEWRFQWRKGGQGWFTAPGSASQALPVDSSAHTVEFTTTALRGATNYQVRLVAVNSANKLQAVSAPQTFTTATAPQAPAVTVASPSAVTTGGATISGTVNPRGDTADWRVQISADPACASGFEDQPLQEVSPSANSPVNVSFPVTGLLPSEHYCARILATNSAGSTTSSVQQFETDDTLPTQVFAAYAAPRTDTTARINGYVNPEGSEATYRFEYSPDGSNWTTLPEEQTTEDRHQIVVASELSGLQPASTYHYRFTVETSAGPVQSDEKTFETRTTAEMQLSQRGIELVNPPDKGNQNPSVAFPSGDPNLVRADGNRVVWQVISGAPGAANGAVNYFLSSRAAGGWASRALAPPANQQVGGGEFAYKLNLIAPDFRHFLMRAAQTGAQEDGPPTFVRLDDEQHQEVLKEFTNTYLGEGYENADMTSDGAHVISQNPETHQLEELGSEPHQVVSIMPDGLPAECGVRSASFYGQSGNGGPASSQWQSNYDRIATTDASRLYFQAFANGSACTASSEHHYGIYYRDRSAASTVEVESGDGVASDPELIRSTPDGRSVFFTTEAPRSPADENSSRDVYRWDADSNTYTCLTCVVDDARVTGRVLVSDDFTHVYFTSTAPLVAGHGVPGEPSIYSVSDGGLQFVVSGVSSVNTLNNTKLSGDGNVLLFKTIHGLPNTELTSDEQAEECQEFLFDTKTPGCVQFFRYEDSTNSVECLSCLPGGVSAYDVGEISGGTALSEDGSTVAFVTHERLLPEDINNSEDIYEWHNGALRLISDGETVYPSTGFTSTPRVYGIDAGGENIFFTIIDPTLTGYEHDKLANLYDARVGGGFPRPSEPTHCSEESCQGALLPPPPQQRVGSSSLNGAGNGAQARKGRCAGKAGKARRRCLRRKHRKHAQKRHRKHRRQSATQGNSGRSDRGSK
jgi:hypothetical protein